MWALPDTCVYVRLYLHLCIDSQTLQSKSMRRIGNGIVHVCDVKDAEHP